MQHCIWEGSKLRCRKTNGWTYLAVLNFKPFGEGLVTVVVPQLRRGENSLSLWNCLDLSSPLLSPVHTFVGHNDVVLEFQWRSQRIGGKILVFIVVFFTFIFCFLFFSYSALPPSFSCLVLLGCSSCSPPFRPPLPTTLSPFLSLFSLFFSGNLFLSSLFSVSSFFIIPSFFLWACSFSRFSSSHFPLTFFFSSLFSVHPVIYPPSRVLLFTSLYPYSSFSSHPFLAPYFFSSLEFLIFASFSAPLSSSFPVLPSNSLISYFTLLLNLDHLNLYSMPFPLDEEQFQLITWSKDHSLRFWAIEPRIIRVRARIRLSCYWYMNMITDWYKQYKTVWW